MQSAAMLRRGAHDVCRRPLDRRGGSPRPRPGISYVSEPRRAEARFRACPGRGVRRTTLHAALAARAKEQDTEWISRRVTRLDQDAAGGTAGGGGAARVGG